MGRKKIDARTRAPRGRRGSFFFCPRNRKDRESVERAETRAVLSFSPVHSGLSRSIYTLSRLSFRPSSRALPDAIFRFSALPTVPSSSLRFFLARHYGSRTLQRASLARSFVRSLVPPLPYNNSINVDAGVSFDSHRPHCDELSSTIQLRSNATISCHGHAAAQSIVQLCKSKR